MTKRIVAILVALLGTTGGIVNAQEAAPSVGAAVLCQAMEDGITGGAEFRIESDLAGEIVSAHDVRRGLHRFYNEDVVSAFSYEHPIRALLAAVSILLGLGKLRRSSL